MRKLTILLPLFILGSSLSLCAQNIVVFDSEDACIVENNCYRGIKAEKEFLKNYKKAVKKGFSETVRLELTTPPLDWGRKVSDETYGEIAHQASYESGFVTDLALYNLLPNHDYRLTLNGRPDLKGNDLLPTAVPGNEKEKYFDFLTITTNDKGEYKTRFGIIMNPGEYKVRFYVKDTDDFKIVLYQDYFPFLVE